MDLIPIIVENEYCNQVDQLWHLPLSNKFSSIINEEVKMGDKKKDEQIISTMLV